MLALAVAFRRLMSTHEQTLLQLDDGHTIPPTPVQLTPDSAQGVLIPRRQQGMVRGRPALAASGDCLTDPVREVRVGPPGRSQAAYSTNTLPLSGGAPEGS